MTNNILNYKEKTIMLAIIDLDVPAYGVNIIHKIEEQTGRVFNVVTIYNVLTGLEKKGFVTSYEGERTPERGNCPKRYFEILQKGYLAINESSKT